MTLYSIEYYSKYMQFFYTERFFLTELQAMVTELQDYFWNKPSNNLFT